MPVQIGKKRESDFSNPLGLLSDCHRRIEHFLDVLVRVCQGAKGRSLNTEERVAAENALAYFRNSAPKHTADEEESLFPRLRSSSEAGPGIEQLGELERDHLAAARDHEAVESLIGRWMNAGTLSDEESRALAETLARLTGTYKRHIAIEDQQLFPLAARLLGPDELESVGQEMADRRGVRR